MASMVALTGMAAGAAEEAWVTQDQYPSFTVVVAPEAPAMDTLAATELQRYWEEVTGHRPEIVTTPQTGPAVWVGAAAVPENAWPEGVDPKAFGPQEIYLKTLELDGTPKLIVAGGPQNGTLYAAYQFIEDALGVRWLAPGVTHIPAAPESIAAIDHRYEPNFEFRWSTYFSRIDDQEALHYYRQVHRWLAGPGFSCHTFYGYVPPEKYFKDHPEYFSLVDGKRIAPTYDWHNHLNHRDHPGEQGQICMTHPEVLDIIYQKIVEEIAANPGNTVHHVSQMDWGNWCECPNCSAIDEQEESQMGSVLWGLNQIADRLANEHPEHRIETLAYTYTRKPPKNLTPRDNVIIKLCSIECDFSRPFDSPKSVANRGFASDIEIWSKIAPRLHVWDYLTNFTNFQSPVPNFHVIQPNMQFLAAHKVKGMFPQGAYDAAAEFAPLRAYLLSKTMWNINLDFDAVMNEWIDLYYQEVAPHVKQYIELLSERQQANGGQFMGCFDVGDWYDYATVERARALFDEAFAAVQSDEIRTRLNVLNATVEYAAFKCPPRLTITDSHITAERPPSLDVDEYLAMLRSHGMKTIMDFSPVELWLESITGTRPARYAESTLEKLENDRYLVWVAPGLQGSVLRWRDKKHGIELLRGYECYGIGGCTWQDWVNTPGIPEHPPADAYTVIAKDAASLTIRAELPSGAALERTMTLAPGSDELMVELAFINESDKPLRSNAKVHPEFFTQGTARPEIWAEKDGKWEMLNINAPEGSPAHGAIVEAGDYERLACWLPEAKFSLYTRWDADGVANLLYFFDVAESREQVNLELLPANTEIAPGERTTLRAAYGVSSKKPKRLPK
jgi:hypothetical protein